MKIILIKIKIIIFYLRQSLPAIFGWIFGFPFTLVIKRDPCLTVIIGRPGVIFADNSKYFFIYATELAQKRERVVFLTTDPSIRDMIIVAGGKSILYPTLRSFYLLLKCKKIVFDWVMIPYIYPLTRGAKLVQIWHGLTLKHIELDVYRKALDRMHSWARPLLKLQKKLIGRYPVYDVVVTTSQQFIKSTFNRCFAARKFIATGYPRNDILYGLPTTGTVAYRLALINVDESALKAVNSAKYSGNKICLYAPTFREKKDNPFKTQIDLSRLSKFAIKNDLLFILKLHPVMFRQCSISNYPGLIEYAPLGDVYPLMPLCDLLITDYSSIYFDFLLLDRPILFFAYDLDSYLAQERDMYFDYSAMTPGGKCRDQDELEWKIETIITNGCDDRYGEMRKKVRSFTYDHIDNQSHQRLLESI